MSELSDKLARILVASGMEDMRQEAVEELRALEADNTALRKRVEGLERIKSAFEYLAVESEVGVIETEAAQHGGLLSRAEHDKRIAQFIRGTLAAEEEA